MDSMSKKDQDIPCELLVRNRLCLILVSSIAMKPDGLLPGHVRNLTNAQQLHTDFPFEFKSDQSFDS